MIGPLASLRRRAATGHGGQIPDVNEGVSAKPNTWLLQSGENPEANRDRGERRLIIQPGCAEPDAAWLKLLGGPMKRRTVLPLAKSLICATVVVASMCLSARAQNDPLPSWNEGAVNTKRGWSVVDMRADWKVIYPFEKQ